MMTREEAIRIISLEKTGNYYPRFTNEEIDQAFSMAIHRNDT